MAEEKIYRITEDSLKAIAEAIREKNGERRTYEVYEMPDEIRKGSVSAYIQDGENKIYLSGQYNGLPLFLNENGYINLRNYIQENNFPLDVTVETMVPTGTLDVTANGEYDVSIYEKVNVNVIDEDYLNYLNGTFGDTYYAPEGANQIKGYSFYNNQTIKGLVCSSTIKGLGTWCCRDAKKLINVQLNNGLEIIGIYAFYNCTALEEVVIPETVIEIGNYAFNGCTSLNKVNIPNGVQTIQNYCFANCSNLKELTIPQSVTQMNNYSLTFGSNGDATLIVEATTPPVITSLAIGSGIGRIIVPKGTLSAYQSATNWSAKADIMEEEE